MAYALLRFGVMETARRFDLVLLASTASLLALLLFAASASAWESTAWRTADGRLYFGSAPPPGSVQTTDIRVAASRIEAHRPSHAGTPQLLVEKKVRQRTRTTVLVSAPRPTTPRVRSDGIAFVAPPRTVGEGEHRALTTCVRNDGRVAKRVWMAGAETVPVGVIAPDGVKCVTVPAPRASVGPSDFWLEAEAANGA